MKQIVKWLISILLAILGVMVGRIVLEYSQGK